MLRASMIMSRAVVYLVTDVEMNVFMSVDKERRTRSQCLEAIIETKAQSALVKQQAVKDAAAKRLARKKSELSGESPMETDAVPVKDRFNLVQSRQQAAADKAAVVEMQASKERRKKDKALKLLADKAAGSTAVLGTVTVKMETNAESPDKPST